MKERPKNAKHGERLIADLNARHQNRFENGFSAVSPGSNMGLKRISALFVAAVKHSQSVLGVVVRLMFLKNKLMR